jgi:methionine-S-sulfoxide reductase
MPFRAVLGRRSCRPWPAGFEDAVFGLGCFWGAERKFWQAPGVYTTAVGYAGGSTPNPTYREVCSGMTGHTEVVRVVFDPAKTSFAALLRIFWENHDPTQGMRRATTSAQYRSAISAPARAAATARASCEAFRRSSRARLARSPEIKASPVLRRARRRTASCASTTPRTITASTSKNPDGYPESTVPSAARARLER